MPTFYLQEKLPKIESLPLIKIERKHSYTDLWDMCECNHLISGHYFIPIWGQAENCGYENCKCKKYKAKEFKIEVKVSKLDMFKFENPNCGSEEYPQFWLDYNIWEKNDKTKGI